MTIKERKILIAKHMKDIPQLQRAAEEAGSCTVNENLGWTKGYIVGLRHHEYATHEEMNSSER